MAVGLCTYTALSRAHKQIIRRVIKTRLIVINFNSHSLSVHLERFDWWTVDTAFAHPDLWVAFESVSFLRPAWCCQGLQSQTDLMYTFPCLSLVLLVHTPHA